MFLGLVVTCHHWVGNHLKFTIWFSNITRNRSLMSSKRSFSSTFTVLSPSGLWQSDGKIWTQLKVKSPDKSIEDTEQKQHWLSASSQLPRNWLHMCGHVWTLCPAFPFGLHIYINDNVSPFGVLKELNFGVLSLSKLEYASSFRGCTRTWTLVALWGY